MAHKYVYLFSEGNADMRELLGGKGANLAEMTNIGLPVPQGFTITRRGVYLWLTKITEGCFMDRITSFTVFALLFILKCLLFFEGFEVAAAFRLGFLEVEVEIVAAFLS